MEYVDESEFAEFKWWVSEKEGFEENDGLFRFWGDLGFVVLFIACYGEWEIDVQEGGRRVY